MLQFKVVLFDAAERHYPCENWFDAIVLFDALCKAYPRVQMWRGNAVEQEYNAAA